MDGRSNFYFLIPKAIRLFFGFECYDVTAMMNLVKRFRLRRLNQLIKRKPEMADDTSLAETDHLIGKILIIKYVLNILKLAIIIVCSSYILGTFWLVLCEYQEKFIDDTNYVDFYEENPDSDQYPERFLVYFGMLDKDPFERLIIVTYFAFTSLSTVGFGDYHPRSDSERLLCAFILLFGVAIFSLIMGTFTEILDEFRDFNKSIDYGDDLARFFGLLKKYNNRESIDLTLKRNIEAHFDYKWTMDKNQMLEAAEDQMLFD